MNVLQKVVLENEVVLRIDQNKKTVTYSYGAKEGKKLNVSQQKIICKLAQSVNSEVESKDLYSEYKKDDEDVGENDAFVRQKVSKMRDKFPDEIKNSIKAVRGKGYILKAKSSGFFNDITNETCADKERSKEVLCNLIGNYYGFYLNPLATGEILGSYIHVENEDDTGKMLKAYAIFNIRSDKILFSDKISNVFSSESQSYQEQFNKLKTGLDEDDRRCFFGKGYVISDEQLAIITLDAECNGGKWVIIVDLKEYIRYKNGEINKDNCYKGGLGLGFAFKTKHDGTMCFRIGLVRKEFIKNFIRLENDDIKSKLKILDDSKDAIWKPLKLSGWLDRQWYNWMMSKPR